MGASSTSPQTTYIGHKPKQGTQQGHTPHPLGPVWAVGSNHVNVHTFGTQQPNKLLALIRHTTHWGRQRSHNANTQHRAGMRIDLRLAGINDHHAEAPERMISMAICTAGTTKPEDRPERPK